MSDTGQGPALRGQQRQEVAARLASRFVQDAVSIHDLATELHRRPTMVRRLLAGAGIQDDGACIGGEVDAVARVLGDRYLAGASLRKLAHDTGIDRRVVRGLLVGVGVRIPERRAMPEESGNWVIRQYEAGATLRALAASTGCSYATVRRHLLRAGVVLRGSGGRR
ncbi:MAG TPA: helix-turn-helix domain-containing protein [Pseudonocardiaceae bacterium]|nr:helix-turn-helix domain-containing protein [Pseudonocardiaceae bacterium]